MAVSIQTALSSARGSEFNAEGRSQSELVKLSRRKMLVICCRHKRLPGSGTAGPALRPFQELRRFLAQKWKQPVCRLREEPRQGQVNAQSIVKHFDAPLRSLPQRAHAKVQRIALPRRLLHRDHRAELTWGSGKAFSKATNGFSLAMVMGDGD